MKAIVSTARGMFAPSPYPTRLTTAGRWCGVLPSICGSDPHPYHGVMPVPPGVVLGHECVGVVEDVGRDVGRFKKATA
jgi:threonine dehydrogenase-like Zn-dependent dehydrogenase